MKTTFRCRREDPLLARVPARDLLLRNGRRRRAGAACCDFSSSRPPPKIHVRPDRPPRPPKGPAGAWPHSCHCSRASGRTSSGGVLLLAVRRRRRGGRGAAGRAPRAGRPRRPLEPAGAEAEARGVGVRRAALRAQALRGSFASRLRVLQAAVGHCVLERRAAGSTTRWRRAVCSLMTMSPGSTRRRPVTAIWSARPRNFGRLMSVS